MQLKTIEYSQYVNTPREWKLTESCFNKISLLVGVNTSGKSRTLSVIAGLARILNSDTLTIGHGYYDVHFYNDQDHIQYILKIVKSVVLHEEIIINDVVKLKRDVSGKGEIFTNQLNDDMSFKVPENRVASVVKRDTEQHTFLEPLHSWASGLVYVQFNDNTERKTFVSFVEGIKNNEIRSNPIFLFKRGVDKYTNEFVSNILLDMKSIGYIITDVQITQPDDIIINHGPPVHCLSIQEDNLDCITSQNEMSDGLFRALSLIIKLNYMMLNEYASVLIVDDIGEGLDFNRARRIVDLIISRTKNSKFQVLMSTNDQFIMDGVDLDVWSIINRQKGVVTITNKHTDPDVFEDFKFIGLNNFEFFSSEFYKGK